MLMNKNIFINSFILINLIILTFLTTSLSDFLMIWFIMELTNFLFMSLMSMMNNNKKMIFFYLMIQILSSSLLLMIFSINMLYINKFYLSIISMILMLKLSIPPFHYWMLMIINHLNWITLILILSIQKIIPFYLLMLFLNNYSLLLYIMIIMSLLIPPFNLINSTNYKKIFLYSSINQSGWFIMLILIKNIIWLMYFSIYSFIMTTIIILSNIMSLSHNHLNNSINIILINLFTFFNIASLPPFSFILFKWINIYIFISNFIFNIILIIFMFNSLIMVYIYLNMINLSMYTWSMSNKLIFKKYNPNYFILYSFMFIMFMSIFFISI